MNTNHFSRSTRFMILGYFSISVAVCKLYAGYTVIPDKGVTTETTIDPGKENTNAQTCVYTHFIQ